MGLHARFGESSKALGLAEKLEAKRQAAEDAALDAKGVPTAATNLSLGFTDLKGSIPVKILDKMMVLLSDKQASKTLETLGTLAPDAELPTGTICPSEPSSSEYSYSSYSSE